MKKFLALTLAIIMVFALAVPALADDPQGTVTITKAYTYGNNTVHVEFSDPVYMNPSGNWFSACVSPWNDSHVLGGALNNAVPDSGSQPCSSWTFTLSSGNFADFFETVSAAGETPQLLIENPGASANGYCGAFYADSMNILKADTPSNQSLTTISKVDPVEVVSCQSTGNDIVTVEFSEEVVPENYYVTLADENGGNWYAGALNTLVNPTGSFSTPSKLWSFKLSNGFSTMDAAYDYFSGEGATPCLVIQQTVAQESGMNKTFKTSDGRFLKANKLLWGSDNAAVHPIVKKDAVKLTNVYTYGDTQLKVKLNEAVKYNGSMWAFLEIYKNDGTFHANLNGKTFMELGSPALSSDKKTLTFDMMFPQVVTDMGVSSWKELFEYYSDETRAGADCKVRIYLQDTSSKSLDGDCNFIESDATSGKFLEASSIEWNDTAFAFVELRDEDLVYIDDISRVDDSTLQVTFSEGVDIAPGTTAYVQAIANGENFVSEWFFDEFHSASYDVRMPAAFNATDDPAVWEVKVTPVYTAGDATPDYNAKNILDLAVFYKYKIVSADDAAHTGWKTSEDKFCLDIFDVKNNIKSLDGERTLNANLLDGGIKRISSTEIDLDEFDIPTVTEGIVRDKVAALDKMPTIDGKFDEGEWGDPIVVTNPAHCQETWGNFWRFDPPYVKPYQTAKVYMTNDDKYIYLAASIDHAEFDAPVDSKDMLYWGPHFGFTVAKYDKENGVPHINFPYPDGPEYEQYAKYTIGLLKDKTKAQNCESLGIKAEDLPEENYQITYDAAAKTYYYEVKLPIAMTNVDLYDTLDANVSFSISPDSRNGIEANRYCITTGMASSKSEPNNFEHKISSLKVALNDAAKKVETWVSTEAPLLQGEIAIDGKIEDAWGKAVVSTTPGHCQETWGNFWQFTGADPADMGQNAKLYVTNDEKYLYVGATIDECDFDETCTDPAKLYAAAHFGFSVSGYDKENTYKHIPFEGDEYEQFTGFMMGFVNGKKASTSNTMGHERWDLPDEDYAVFYDPETRTYTYECRIPFSKTNITSSEIAISASIGCPYTGGVDQNGVPGTNRYNITTGYAMAKCIAGDFSHKDNALHLNLAIVPDTGDSFNFFAAIAICAVALTACTALVIVRRKSKTE